MAVWGDIQTLVKANLGRQADASVAALLPIWADLFQKKVQRDRRYWFLKTTAERTINQAAQAYPLPSGYREGMVIYLKKLTPAETSMEYVELDQISDLDVLRLFQPTVDSNNVPQSAYMAQPYCYTIGDTTVTFWPWPMKQYTVRCQYWQDIAPPVAGSLTSFVNIWITDYPELYEAELTAAGWRYLGKSDKAMEWDMRAKDILKEVRMANVMRELAGPGKLALTPNQSQYGTTLSTRTRTWRVF